MCGIAGIIGVKQSGLSIQTMLDRIRHRGPNGQSTWEEGDIAFAHARLSIIDLSDDANQPMTDPATGNVIVFNGEIYNYIELKNLIGNRYTFVTQSDTEVILAAYAVFGIDFLQHLRGMFAIALFDKSINKVLLARGRLAIKPLYYRTFNGALLFASEIKALVNLGHGSEQIHELKAYEFLANCQLDTDEHTMFVGVKQLLPGQIAWIDHTGVMSQPTAYWHFPNPGNIQYTAAHEQSLVNVFEETVRLHLRSDVPVGSFLSGGIDSTSICYFALRNLTQEQLHTFSARLPYHHPENDLIPRVIESEKKFIPHTFLMDGAGFFDDIPSIIYHHDEPILDGSMYAHFKLCAMAKAAGIKVLLSGSGGDELFGGYASHVHAHHASLVRNGRLGMFIKDIQSIKKNTGMSVVSLLTHGLYENLSVNVKRRMKNKQLKSRATHVLIHPSVRHYYYEHTNPYHANLLNNYQSWTAPPFLHYEDRNSMAHGVEVRVPFFDHTLIEFVMQFDAQTILSGQSKSLLRNAFKHIVPDYILQQKGKYGFPSPIDHCLQHDKIGQQIFYDFYRETPLLHIPEVEKLASNFHKNGNRLSEYWRTLSYIIWYQIFFKGWKGFIGPLSK